MASGTANGASQRLAGAENGSPKVGAHAQSDVNKLDKFIKKGEEILETFVTSIRAFEGQTLKIKDLSASVNEIKSSMKRKDADSGINDEENTNKKRRVVPVEQEFDEISDDSEQDSDEDENIDKILNEPGPSHHNQSSSQIEDDVLGELDEFFVEEEDTAPAIDSTVAKVVNKALRPSKIDKEKIQSLNQKYKRPDNVDALQVPKIDKFLWNQLDTSVKSTDIAKQYMIDDLNKAAGPLVAAMNHTYANNNPDVGYLKECIGDSFKSICSTIAKINTQRRDFIRKEVDYSFKSLCASETNTSATGLFGDKLQEQSKHVDSGMQIKMINKGSFLGKGRGGKGKLPLNRSTQRPDSAVTQNDGNPHQAQKKNFKNHNNQQGHSNFHKTSNRKFGHYGKKFGGKKTERNQKQY